LESLAEDAEKIDLEYTWDYFDMLRDFIARMAGNGRSIIFTTDQ
jgi:hypothetical protein